MSRILSVGDPSALEVAIEELRHGKCVGVPTDTVYGLAAALDHPTAVRLLFDLKQRGDDKALAVLVGSISEASRLGIFDESVLDHLRTIWPGPLTVVTQRDDAIGTELGGDPTSIGLRWASSDLIDRITAAVGPLVTTSANKSGCPTLHTAAEIAAAFGDEIGLVVDGGPASGAASTVIDIRRGHVSVLREGVISGDELQPLFGTLAGLESP